MTHKTREFRTWLLRLLKCLECTGNVPLIYILIMFFPLHLYPEKNTHTKKRNFKFSGSAENDIPLGVVLYAFELVSNYLASILRDDDVDAFPGPRRAGFSQRGGRGGNEPLASTDWCPSQHFHNGFANVCCIYPGGWQASRTVFCAKTTALVALSLFRYDDCDFIPKLPVDCLSYLCFQTLLAFWCFLYSLVFH